MVLTFILKYIWVYNFLFLLLCSTTSCKYIQVTDKFPPECPLNNYEYIKLKISNNNSKISCVEEVQEGLENIEDNHKPTIESCTTILEDLHEKIKLHDIESLNKLIREIPVHILNSILPSTGLTALTLAASYQGYVSYYISAILIRNGADTNLSLNDGSTALIYAVKRSNLPLIALLLLSGADIEKADNLDHTPLLHSIHAGDLEITKFLLQCGADPNIKSRFGLTPLYYLLQEPPNNLTGSFTSLLLDYNASITEVTLDGKDAISFIINIADSSLLRLVITHPAFKNYSEIHSIEASTLVKSSYFNIKIATDTISRIITALRLKMDQDLIISLLIPEIKSKNREICTSKDEDDRTLVWWAAHYGNHRLMKVLMDFYYSQRQTNSFEYEQCSIHNPDIYGHYPIGHIIFSGTFSMYRDKQLLEDILLYQSPSTNATLWYILSVYGGSIGEQRLTEYLSTFVDFKMLSFLTRYFCKPLKKSEIPAPRWIPYIGTDEYDKIVTILSTLLILRKNYTAKVVLQSILREAMLQSFWCIQVLQHGLITAAILGKYDVIKSILLARAQTLSEVLTSLNYSSPRSVNIALCLIGSIPPKFPNFEYLMMAPITLIVRHIFHSNSSKTQKYKNYMNQAFSKITLNNPSLLNDRKTPLHDEDSSNIKYSGIKPNSQLYVDSSNQEFTFRFVNNQHLLDGPFSVFQRLLSPETGRFVRSSSLNLTLELLQEVTCMSNNRPDIHSSIENSRYINDSEYEEDFGESLGNSQRTTKRVIDEYKFFNVYSTQAPTQTYHSAAIPGVNKGDTADNCFIKTTSLCKFMLKTNLIWTPMMLDTGFHPLSTILSDYQSKSRFLSLPTLTSKYQQIHLGYLPPIPLKTNITDLGPLIPVDILFEYIEEHSACQNIMTYTSFDDLLAKKIQIITLISESIHFHMIPSIANVSISIILVVLLYFILWASLGWIKVLLVEKTKYNINSTNFTDATDPSEIQDYSETRMSEPILNNEFINTNSLEYTIDSIDQEITFDKKQEPEVSVNVNLYRKEENLSNSQSANTHQLNRKFSHSSDNECDICTNHEIKADEGNPSSLESSDTTNLTSLLYKTSKFSINGQFGKDCVKSSISSSSSYSSSLHVPKSASLKDLDIQYLPASTLLLKESNKRKFEFNNTFVHKRPNTTLRTGAIHRNDIVYKWNNFKIMLLNLIPKILLNLEDYALVFPLPGKRDLIDSLIGSITITLTSPWYIYQTKFQSFNHIRNSNIHNIHYNIWINFLCNSNINKNILLSKNNYSTYIQCGLRIFCLICQLASLSYICIFLLLNRGFDYFWFFLGTALVAILNLTIRCYYTSDFVNEYFEEYFCGFYKGFKKSSDNYCTKADSLDNINNTSYSEKMMINQDDIYADHINKQILENYCDCLSEQERSYHKLDIAETHDQSNTKLLISQNDCNANLESNSEKSAEPSNAAIDSEYKYLDRPIENNDILQTGRKISKITRNITICINHNEKFVSGTNKLHTSTYPNSPTMREDSMKRSSNIDKITPHRLTNSMDDINGIEHLEIDNTSITSPNSQVYCNKVFTTRDNDHYKDIRQEEMQNLTNTIKNKTNNFHTPLYNLADNVSYNTARDYFIVVSVCKLISILIAMSSDISIVLFGNNSFLFRDFALYFLYTESPTMAFITGCIFTLWLSSFIFEIIKGMILLVFFVKQRKRLCNILVQHIPIQFRYSNAQEFIQVLSYWRSVMQHVLYKNTKLWTQFFDISVSINTLLLFILGKLIIIFIYIKKNKLFGLQNHSKYMNNISNYSRLYSGGMYNTLLNEYNPMDPYNLDKYNLSNSIMGSNIYIYSNWEIIFISLSITIVVFISYIIRLLYQVNKSAIRTYSWLQNILHRTPPGAGIYIVIEKVVLVISSTPPIIKLCGIDVTERFAGFNLYIFTPIIILCIIKLIIY
ncbi:hypothetical protein cand_014620 [Cryptosporidium andersoni]|uniref:Uncharacterized protein n=1 Tax=Cryptosporidium andersoni TaxID=117008 RepID=A0A1J4MU01_9CRYT|nr:hypothetical protein cand_014620 [Cryptosporidium andersoni]